MRLLHVWAGGVSTAQPQLECRETFVLGAGWRVWTGMGRCCARSGWRNVSLNAERQCCLAEWQGGDCGLGRGAAARVRAEAISLNADRQCCLAGWRSWTGTGRCCARSGWRSARARPTTRASCAAPRWSGRCAAPSRPASFCYGVSVANVHAHEQGLPSAQGMPPVVSMLP